MAAEFADADWGCWSQGAMGATGIVVTRPLTQDSSQVQCAEWDQVVQAFATYSANQTFAMSIGGRRMNGRSQHGDTPALDLFVEVGRESLMPIVQKEFAILITGQRFSQLL